MNRDNVLYFAIAISLPANGFAQSQPPHPPKPPSPAERLERMKTDLTLSDAQVQKLQPILEANMERMKTLHEDTSLTEDQKREKSREVRKEGGDAIMAVLNPDQKAKFEEALKKRRKDGAPGGGHPEAGGSGSGGKRESPKQ